MVLARWQWWNEGVLQLINPSLFVYLGITSAVIGNSWFDVDHANWDSKKRKWSKIRGRVGGILIRIIAYSRLIQEVHSRIKFKNSWGRLEVRLIYPYVSFSTLRKTSDWQCNNLVNSMLACRWTGTNPFRKKRGGMNSSHDKSVAIIAIQCPVM